MTKRWSESVRGSGRLRVWAGGTASGGWAVALERAVKEFNRAAHARKLALRFELTTREAEAEVTFGVGSRDQFASATHGTTELSSQESDGTIVKADILVHPSPQVRVFRKKAGSKDYEEVSREAGENIRVVIIVHEFVHACGLENHSNNESPDVFYSPLEPNAGDRPQGDFMKVPIVKGIRLPPVVLSAQTAHRLREVWK